MSSSSSCPSSLDSVHGIHPSLQRAARPAAASTKKSSMGGPKSSVGGLPLSDVGMGGGNVEDGTAWSMVARFVCSVPGCGASFTRKQNLQRHQTQKHGRPKTHTRNSADGYVDDDVDDDDDDGTDTIAAFYQ